MHFKISSIIIVFFFLLLESVFLPPSTENEADVQQHPEFLIQLKILETLSHLFLKNKENKPEEISVHDLEKNAFWMEHITNEVLSNEYKGDYLNMTKVSFQGAKERQTALNRSLLPDTAAIKDFFEKLVDLQMTLKKIDIIQHFQFNGFEAIKAQLSPDLFTLLKSNPFVADIDTNEQFQAFTVDFQTNNASSYVDKKLAGEDNPVAIQYQAPRHLARLSQRSKISSEDSEDLNYFYQNNFTGNNISVYILDTGISADHPQFEGRIRYGQSFVNEPLGDFNGHGSHVAGIVGAKDYGVCKNCELVEVKCLDKNGQGDLTTVISALGFAVDDMLKTGKKAVANLSLGSFKSKILNEAVRAAVLNGLVVVVAAGNSNMNACLNSPASEPVAITVGAMDDRYDRIASFSNWGECVDIFASGVKVESLSHVDFESSLRFSGTSMATPSVAGLAAILLDMGLESDQIKDKLIEVSSKNLLKKRHLIRKPRTPNRLLFNDVFTLKEDYDNYLNQSAKSKCECNWEVFKDNKLQNSDVPIKDTLAKRENWFEPNFSQLQNIAILS